MQEISFEEQLQEGGFASESEFLEYILCTDENYTLEDFFDSYDPE